MGVALSAWRATRPTSGAMTDRRGRHVAGAVARRVPGDTEDHRRRWRCRCGGRRPDRRIPVALLIDQDYAERLRRAGSREVALLHDSTWPESARLADHLRYGADRLRAVRRHTRLVLRGIAPSAIAGLRIVDRDFSTAADRAGRTLATMPIFVLLAAFIGGMSIAADVTAGERERGSLESLLLHPVSRLASPAANGSPSPRACPRSRWPSPCRSWCCSILGCKSSTCRSA